MPVADIALSCLVDDDPVFFMQAWNWLTSLRRLGTHERADIFIHHVEEIPRGRLKTMADLGAHLVPVTRFGDGPAAYCNKVRQMATPALADYDHVILSDADIAFARCPTALATGAAVRGKQVDLPNPPEEIWRPLLERAGLAERASVSPLELRAGTSTFSTNLNGGLYIIPRAAWPVLAEGWQTWARFCLDQQVLLGKYTKHADQLGFGMTLLAADLPLEPLGLAANFPLHLRHAHASLEPRELIGIHYHRELDNHGLIRMGGVSWIDEQVRSVNSGLVEARRELMDNAIFWDFRYRTDPALGSGAGSRGAVLRHKRSLLLPYFRAFAEREVLDVGCGDLETTRYMPTARYRGIDLSAEAVELARSKRPDWSFDVGALANVPDSSYDLILCLDVLLHQSSPADIDGLVADLVRAARGAVIVSGYVQPPAQEGIVFFSTPIDELLRKQPGVREVVRIGGYRDVDLFLVIKSGAASPNQHDIGLPGLAYGMTLTPHWSLLLELVDLSRQHLGFFPSTIIRTIEYPWLASRLERHAGARVLDVGAGVCVLPFWLAERGCAVTTVDNHPMERSADSRNRWNEWGYLDYASIDPRIMSAHQDAAAFTADEPYEAIYSISVLEHLPAGLRRRIFANLASQLAPAGRLYLSFDLIPRSRKLWRMSEGKEVEAEEVHGTFDDILDELTAVGLEVTDVSTVTGIRDSRTDVAFLEARPAGS